ncbi:MAG: carbon-nitrogen hydrolase family protein [Syntrophomonadaceae bacterium]
MADILKLAICQMLIGSDKSANLAHAGQMVDEAAQNGAQIVVLPEIFSIPYQTDLMVKHAEVCPGPTTFYLADLARSNRVILVGGSIPEKDKEGRIFNTSFIFDEQGLLIGKHRKMHLFDIDIPGQMTFRESEKLSAGNSLEVVQHPALKLAVIICYDIRFPELVRWAVLEGAQLLVVPAAFNMTTGPAHWEILFRNRAVDNQLFVAAASPARNIGSSYQAWGHSMIVDPWGTVIGQAGSDETILYADLDLDMIGRVRQQLPLLSHRRTDLYRFCYPSP